MGDGKTARSNAVWHLPVESLNTHKRLHRTDASPVPL